jgi:N-acetylglucosaminyldiphosphoundecaprenol N-acetyl-beta-D-mannosaminyltransferase
MGGIAQKERDLMRSLLRIPAAFEAHRAPRSHANDAYEQVLLGGIRTACLSRAELSRMMLIDCFAAREAEGTPPRLVFALNGHTIALAAQDGKFRQVFQRADIIHADGQASVFASRLLTNSPVPERSATTDFIHDAAKVAVEHGLRFFLLGATEEANEKAARILRETYPGLQITGRRHGYFSVLDEDEICDEINLAQPDVIWAGLSVPLEYEFAVRNRNRLKAGWLVTCGGCFHYVSGDYIRAPRWMQKAGLEWLHRIWREPKRLFWRYAVTNPLALFYLLTRTGTLHPGSPVPALATPVRTAA